MSFFTDDAVLEMPRGPHPWGRRFQRRGEVRSGLASRFAGIPDAYTARTVIGSAAQRRQTVVAATVVFPDQRRVAYDPAGIGGCGPACCWTP
jgi:hypothetical protein